MCAIRIGLWWAHDVFTIASHMLMRFQAYVLFILYIRIYWTVWDFSDCLFLPPSPPLFLSLSLVYISCVTAPKRKSAPSWNPLRSGASTSSDPTPSSIRFRDKKSKTNFFENFSRRGIHSECQVILSDFSDTILPTVIHNRGWESLCDVPVTYPSVLIHEFYSNMHGFDYSVPLFVTRVRGTRIVVTPDIVSDVLHVPRVAHPNYPDRKSVV